MDTNGNNDQPPSSPIPIAQINPDLDRLSENSIRATVTLVWPYSSSTKAFSFLLAEPDFRLRRSNGQVKVVFHGLVAEKVAESRVGIGDEAVLSLAGSQLEKNETATQTPGRYVAWDVHFDDRVLLEISRSSNHYATVKIDPPVELAQPTEDERPPPVTPVPSRTRPEETPATGTLGSWTSPAFFQRSRASFGNIVDSRLDPFADEDGFVPGKGRKRPRFSMRSSEWRLIDEPASLEEKGGPVDWTQELEDEIESEPEPDVDGKGTTEDIEMPQETPVTTGPSPSAEPICGGTTIEDTTITVDRPTPEPSVDVEQPVEQEATRAAELAPGVHEEKYYVNGFHLPIDTPRLLPIPSPGLPVPSPLVSADNRQGYFPSAAAAIAQTSAPQQSTTVAQYETTRVGDNAETRTRIIQTETVEAPVAQTADEGAPIYLHETVLEGPTPTATADSAEPLVKDEVQSDERNETTATHGHQHEPSPSPNREAPVEEKAHIEHISIQPSDDVEMEDAEQVLDDKHDESEENDEDSQEEESDEKSDMKEIEDESENEGEEIDEEEDKEDDDKGSEEGDRANQAIDLRSHEAHDEQHAEDRTEGSGKTALSLAEAYSESKGNQGHYIEVEEEEDDEDEDEDQEMDGDEEASQGDYETENVYEDEDKDVVDSESESDGEHHQVQHPHKTAQPEIIVLDSDYEDEQPDANSQAQPPAYPEQDQSEESASDQELSDDGRRAEQGEEDWYSDEQEQLEVEDEVMAEGEYDDDEGHYVEDEDGYVEDEAPPEEETMKDGDQGHYVEDDDEDGYSDDEEESAEEDTVRDEERVDQVEMVERTRRIENEQITEPATDEQEQGILAKDRQEQDEQERDGQELEVTTSAEYETVARPNIGEEPPAGKHHEEAHATENLPRHFEQDLHEHPATHAPLETVSDAASNQSETIPDDAGSNGRQETAEETNEVRIEETSTTAELDQDKDSGLWYDGAMSPRVGHDTTTITVETFEPSNLSLHTRQADDTVGTEYSHQVSVDHSISEKAIASQEHASSREQAEFSVEGDEAMVEAPGVPEANGLPTTEQEPRSRSASLSQHEWAEANEFTADEAKLPITEQEPRSRSASIFQHDWAEANEYTADEDVQAQEAVDEETSLQLQLQDETRIRESIEESDSYAQHLAGPYHRYPGLRSKHSYFAPLATLIDHFNTHVDAISVVSEVSSIIHSAFGKKDFLLTLYLTDPSMAGTTLTAQIFRPYLEALPSVSDGDVILLRNFRVKSFNHYMMLVTAETSAWAVFSYSNPQDEAQMTGPPVEYGDEERSHASYLREWYQSDGTAMVADNQLQASIVEASKEMTPMSSVAASDTASLDDFAGRDGRRDSSRKDRRGRKSHRRITIHELRDGRRYTEVGSPSDRESIHELRDGTVYTHL